MREIPSTGAFTDLLWSDPDDIEGFQQSPRGAGYIFGEDVVSEVSGGECIDLTTSLTR